MSLVPTERDTAATSTFLVKPLGDDGVLQTSVSVAVSGLYSSATPGGTPELKVEPDPSCVGITFPSDERYIDFQAGVTDPNDAARRFGCIAKLGKNGCGLEQQLESVLKATYTTRQSDQVNALKPAVYRDRIIVASIVGTPVKEQLGSVTGVTTGAAAIDALLNRNDMQFQVRRNATSTADEPVPTCISAAGDGSAAPARRFLELTKAFGDNGVVTSICELEYRSVLGVIVDKIAAQLADAKSP